MNKPMIENSERGITLNKSLAWTILVALVAAGIWVGTQVTEAQNGIEAAQKGITDLGDRQIEDRTVIVRNTNDIRALQSTGARIDERLLNIEKSQSRAEDKLDSLLGYIRNNGRDVQ